MRGHEGRIVKVMGDGVLVEFASAVNAVAAPIELYVLEGSVRQAGERLRVTGQSIDAAIGNHIRAERYDPASALQDEITVSASPQQRLGQIQRHNLCGTYRGNWGGI